MPSRSARGVVLATAFCALGVAGGCGRENFDLLPPNTLDNGGRAPSAAGNGSSGAGMIGSGGTSGKASSGGGAGRVELGGYGGRITTFPNGGMGNGGMGNFPCLGEAGCPDEAPPCSVSDPYCTPCHSKAECNLVDAKTCDLELKRCVECRKNAHCGLGEVCNPNTWRCAKSCVSSKDSCSVEGQHLTCREDLGVCVACLTGDDCSSYGPFNPRCAPSNTCVECVDDTQCPSMLCVYGHCIQH